MITDKHIIGEGVVQRYLGRQQGVGSRGVRVYPYPRVYPRVRVGYSRCLTGRVGSGTGTTSMGTGTPGFTRKRGAIFHDFLLF